MRAAALLVLVPGVALAQDPYLYLDFKNLSDSTHPFRYYVDNRVATPAGVDVNQVKQMADNAWSQWSSVTCAIPKAQGAGFTTGTVPQPSNPYDAYNVTPVFITDLSDPYYNDVFSWDMAAITLPLQYAGVLQNCDVYLNGDRPWTTGDPVPASFLDVGTVLLHETGHCLGLDHQPYYPESIMETDIEPGQEQRALSATDEDILCTRYPTSGDILSPCNGSGDCGAGQTCVTQMVGGVQKKYCTVGCTVGSNLPCDTPLECQTSSAFSGFNGGCLLPTGNTTLIGHACDPGQPMVDCQSSTAQCLAPNGAFWLGGYCTQSCTSGQAACPAGSSCVTLSYLGAQADECLQSCRVGSADCRPGYTCALPSGSTGGVCIPRCGSDQDCGAGYACRTCDGLCTLLNSSAQVGDVCQLDKDCGFGQLCLQLTAYSQVKICTTPCGQGCGACPGQSTCHPIEVLGNQMFCLRDCSSAFTCPTTEACQNIATGRACLPPCARDLDCAVGLFCIGGTCQPSVIDNDAGCDLCPSSDGGGPIKPHPKDAGLGPGGSGGCGCSAGGAPWALLAVLVRRRFWRRRHR